MKFEGKDSKAKSMKRKRTESFCSDLITASAVFSFWKSPFYTFVFSGFECHGFSLLCVIFASIQLWNNVSFVFLP